MALSGFDKKLLSDLIDQVVNDIKPIVEFARKPELRSMFKDRDGFDFSLGVAVTEINMMFVEGFKLRNKRGLNKEEKAELFNFFGTRMYEIKEAIFKCG